MANRYTKGSSASVNIREIQIKTTIRYHLIPVGMAIIKTQNIKGVKLKKREACVLLVGMAVPQKLQIELPYDQPSHFCMYKEKSTQ
jgi:hypothetical protein